MEKETVLLSDIAPEKLEGVHGLAVCDGCNKRFLPKKALLTETNDTQFAGIRGLVLVKKKDKSYMLTSPCCETEHPHGFRMQLHRIKNGKRKQKN